MKKLSVNFLALAAIGMALLAFTFVKNGGIKGTVTPIDRVTQVIAVAGTDTLRTVLNNGNFSFSEVKPGTYTIWVKAKTPYKDTSVENVAVIDSTITDVGEIKLLQ